MQNLVKVRPQGLRQSVRLEVAASFLHDIKREDVFDLRVPRFRIAVWYEDGQPVVGLGSENISVVNSENPDDLTHLFCVTAFPRYSLTAPTKLLCMALRGVMRKAKIIVVLCR